MKIGDKIKKANITWIYVGDFDVYHLYISCAKLQWTHGTRRREPYGGGMIVDGKCIDEANYWNDWFKNGAYPIIEGYLKLLQDPSISPNSR